MLGFKWETKGKKIIIQTQPRKFEEEKARRKVLKGTIKWNKSERTRRFRWTGQPYWNENAHILKFHMMVADLYD